MIFNSLEFAIFLPIVFLLYWFVFSKSARIQNIFIIIASYIFYGWWDWRFALLVAFVTGCNYLSGIGIKRYENRSLAIILSNVVVNLAVLFYFKYFNFFVGNFIEAFSLFGKHLEISTLKIILPVGISFYTFQALSYSIDVYRKKIEPTSDMVSFFAYISFFPHLTSGPIGRATTLLPQFFKKRQFDYSMAVDGMCQILWGLFKKIVIADNCALCVNYIFGNYEFWPASTLVIGTIYFAIQLYCDFSGYSDIAIGTGRLFGIKLMRNFNYPYFAVSFADYWKRNHISLTQWFMDYVYYPMIGNSDKLRYWNFCMIITFLLSGLWHGANWTFILWGLYQGIFIVISMNSQKYRKKFEKQHSWTKSIFYRFVCIILTFGIVCFGLIFFRADSVSYAFSYIGHIFNPTIISFPVATAYVGKYILFLIPGFFVFEWFQRNEAHALQLKRVRSKAVRWGIYFFVIWLIFNYGGVQAPFVYFQF
jgi:D-alanyl-lipoteichoic acid acyltransferase DltB (MBOAT superfamily)